MAVWKTIVLMLALTVVSMGASCQRTGAAPPAVLTITIKGEAFELEVAADGPARERGLMDRTEIADRGGMIFIFPDAGLRSFWMKNCVVDIDLMFIDSRGRVTAVHGMTVEPPQREGETLAAYQQRLKGYGSVFPAQFAIELQAGSLDRLNVRIEDKIDLDLDTLKGYAR